MMFYIFQDNYGTILLEEKEVSKELVINLIEKSGFQLIFVSDSCIYSSKATTIERFWRLPDFIKPIRRLYYDDPYGMPTKLFEDNKELIAQILDRYEGEPLYDLVKELI